MIPITDLSWQSLSWQTLVSNAIGDSKSLGLALNVELPELDDKFPVNVPLPYLSRMEPQNPNDPLLRQVMVTAHEATTGGSISPLNEEAFNKGFGVLQKYAGRVLVIATGRCAIHCRYCFRRHFPYQDTQASTEDWLSLIHSLQQDDSIFEVILSGGDPLMLSDRRLAWILEQLAAVPHIQTVRIHTRLPIVIPSRVTDGLLKLIESSRLNLVVVTHINHAREIDEFVQRALRALQTSGVTLLNQSVLLRDINDQPQTLIDLSLALSQSGVVPYYLHLMDDVSGAQHFHVDEETGKELIATMRQSLSGYLVPRLAQEIPFETSKRVIA